MYDIEGLRERLKKDSRAYLGLDVERSQNVDSASSVGRSPKEEGGGRMLPGGGGLMSTCNVCPFGATRPTMSTKDELGGNMMAMDTESLRNITACMRLPSGSK